MLALGIDPGTAICGYGLVDMQGSRLKAIEYGAILTSPQMRPQDRLLKIHRELTDIIQKYKPGRRTIIFQSQCNYCHSCRSSSWYRLIDRS